MSTIRRANSPQRLWLAALSITVLWMPVGAFLRKMLDTELLPLLVLAWLTPLAVYDICRREIPHIGWVAFPCFALSLAVLLNGNWTLALLAGVVIVASERHLFPGSRRQGAVLITASLACVVLIGLTPLEQIPGAVMVVSFWLVYELGWWAGADALAGIALAVLWPELRLIVTFALGLLLTSLLLGRLGRLASLGRFRRLSSEELEQLGAPGLPAIAFAAALFIGWSLWLPSRIL